MFPIVHNVDALESSDETAVREKLTAQVSSPVRWLQSVENIAASGVERFVEIGPGKVLTGLVRQINREAVYSNIEDSESLRSTLESL